MFSPHGPSLRELVAQALSSVEHGYDLLAPKFDQTPFRTPARILDASRDALAPLGPFDRGLDVCCGTGAGVEAIGPLCREGVTGVDFSAGMLAQAQRAHPAARWVRADARALPFTEEFDLAVSFGALGHFLPRERPGVFRGVYRALRPGGIFALPVGAAPPVTSPAWWLELGFDAAMRARNLVWRPTFVMYYRVMRPAPVRLDLARAGFTLSEVDLAGGRGQLILAHKPKNPTKKLGTIRSVSYPVDDVDAE